MSGLSGRPPRSASPSAWSWAKDERAVVKESASAFAVLGRLPVRERVRCSLVLGHPPLRRSGDLSAVGLPSGFIKGFAMLLSRIEDRIERVLAILPPLERAERLERVLRSLRFDPVRSDLGGEIRPPKLPGLASRGMRAPAARSQSFPKVCSCVARSCTGEAGAD